MIAHRQWKNLARACVGSLCPGSLLPGGLGDPPTPPQTRWPESPLPGPGLSRPNIRSSSEMATGAPGPAEDPSTSEVKTLCSLPAMPGGPSCLSHPQQRDACQPSGETVSPGAWGCLLPGPHRPWLTPLAPGWTWGLAPPGRLDTSNRHACSWPIPCRGCAHP